MNAFFATRICGYIVLTGGFVALGAAFGQIGLIFAGFLLLVLAASLFNEALKLKYTPPPQERDEERKSPDAATRP